MRLVRHAAWRVPPAHPPTVLAVAGQQTRSKGVRGKRSPLPLGKQGGEAGGRVPRQRRQRKVLQAQRLRDAGRAGAAAVPKRLPSQHV